MTGSKLIDSSVWIAYITKEKHIELIDSENNLLTSAISLFEIKKKFLKDGIKISKLNYNIKMIKDKSTIINITPEIAEKSAEISVKNNIPAIDSLIYTCALENNAILITLDNDFRELENVEVLNN